MKSKASIRPGWAGHDHEICVNFDDYGHFGQSGELRAIPRSLEGKVADELPESWRIDNRDSRLEINPSGHLYGGFDQLDVNAIVRALEYLGYEVAVINP